MYTNYFYCFFVITTLTFAPCVRFFLLSTKDLSWIELLTTLYTTRELPINPNWKINWVIDGFDTSQEIPRGIASLSSNPQYFNSNLNFPVTDQYGNTYDMPDLTVELTDAEIDEHLGDLWITNLGRARYADMLKTDLTTPKLMPKQYGYMLAKKLLRKVSFGTFSKIFKLVFENLVNYCVHYTTSL